MKVPAFLFALLGALPASAGTLGGLGFAVQTPPVERLHNVGQLLYDRFGNEVQLRGFNENNDEFGSSTDTFGFVDRDAAQIKAMGGNVVRWTPAYYHDAQLNNLYPQSGDAYNPTTGVAANGYFDPTILARTDSIVAANSARQIWTIIGFTTGGGDFATPFATYPSGEDPIIWNGGMNANTVIQGQYFDMLAFMAARYKNAPYIACYELWTEPTPLTADMGSRYRNDIVAFIELQAIERIRAVDPVTPICIGPAANYGPRVNYNLTEPFRLVLGSSVWSMNDWYELAGTTGGTYDGYTHQLKPVTNISGCAPPLPACPPFPGQAGFTGIINLTTLSVSAVSGVIHPGATVHGVGVADGTYIVGASGSDWTVSISQSVGSEAMFTGYTTYPDVYDDVKIGEGPPVGNVPCAYPPGSSPVTMTGGNTTPTSFLAGLDDACTVAWSDEIGVPVIMDQIGVATVTPGAWAYDYDQLEMMRVRHQSYMIWALRSKTNGASAVDGYNGGSSGSAAMDFQDLHGNWLVKDSGYYASCNLGPTPYPLDQFNKNYLLTESVSTCDDYYDLFSDEFEVPY